jgi:hypothetical protein
MANSVSMMAQCPGESEEHVALLMDLRRFGLFRRWDDLLDEGVVAVFGVASGEAELLALFFHSGKFTPDRATTWLAERGFKPLLFVPNSGKLAAAHFDDLLAAPIGQAVPRGCTSCARTSRPTRRPAWRRFATP